MADAIRPYVTVFQIQLPGGMTWDHLETCVKAAKSGETMCALVLQEVRPLLQCYLLLSK